VKLWKKGDKPKDRTHIIQVRSSGPDERGSWKNRTAYLPVEAKGETSKTLMEKIKKALGLDGQ